MTLGFPNAKGIYGFKETFREKIEGDHCMQWHTTYSQALRGRDKKNAFLKIFNYMTLGTVTSSV